MDTMSLDCPRLVSRVVEGKKGKRMYVDLFSGSLLGLHMPNPSTIAVVCLEKVFFSNIQKCADTILGCWHNACHESKCADNSSRHTLCPVRNCKGSRVSASDSAADFQRSVGTVQHLCVPVFSLPMGRFVLYGKLLVSWVHELSGSQNLT
jgi:hypothetical protein